MTAESITIHLSSQIILWGKVGRKLATGVGSGAETSVDGRSKIGCQVRIMSSVPNGQIEEATGIVSCGAEFIAV
ncbi:hypothetical protein IEO21_07344 [Rhodonia placenta]|uniref:Uncharacterized protein n=2 Tax=Rhodonia placenta TaxID=104341 RepID=A0A8H7NYA1_9APHY|nr:hypothetical protein IEO21_07344 [Postia placenta]